MKPTTYLSIYLLTAISSGLAIRAQAQPRITSATPLSGPVGSTVTITGLNFRSNATDNIVYFGAVRGQVTSASATTLTVPIPAGATFSPITVTTPDRLTAWSPKPFLPSFGGSATIG